MVDLIQRLRSQEAVDARPQEIEKLTDEAADSLESANARIAEFQRILDGLSQDAIDGGWTARGISAYAKKLEADLVFQKKVTDAARQHQAELLELAEQAETRIAELEAQIAAAEKPEPVGIAGNMPGTEGFTMAAFKAADVPVGANLYTHPLPSDAEGWRKDALRYRHLTNRVVITDASTPGMAVITFVDDAVDEPNQFLDELVDAALAKQQDHS